MAASPQTGTEGAKYVCKERSRQKPFALPTSGLRRKGEDRKKLIIKGGRSNKGKNDNCDP